MRMGRSIGCVGVVLCFSSVALAGPASPLTSARIDELLSQRWKQNAAQPAPVADDATFLRRTMLDLTGTIPSVHDVREFLADERPDKRSRWIDKILSRPNHPTHMAGVWRRGLMPSNNNNLFRLGGGGFENWLRDKFASNTPYDQTAREILTVTAASPAEYFLALEFKPEELAASSSKFFLGVQIQCAQCHNHPFDHWKQHDFWGFAAFFARVQRQQANQANQISVNDSPNTGVVTLPGTNTVVEPRYLGESQATDVAGQTRREQLAAWVTSRDNPYFARATVNRLWAHLFGRGLVEPVDDLGPHNPASHPQLLDELSQSFVATGFNVQSLLRTLTNTKAYQLASESATEEEPALELFARMALKTLTAEQLYDCLAEATHRRDLAPVNQGLVAVRQFDPARQTFLSKFQSLGSPTDFRSGIPQALSLMNGQIVATGIDPTRSDLLTALDAPFLTDQERIEALFLSTLSRLPRDEEREQFAAHMQQAGSQASRHKALGDMLWALLNSAEFVLNH